MMLLPPPPINANPAPAVQWYGPAVAKLPKMATAKYGDEAFRIIVTGPDGKETLRALPFRDGEDWKVKITVPRPGNYTLSGTDPARAALGTVSITNPLPAGVAAGFVRLSADKKGFRFDDGQSYWPMGHNLAWENPDVPDLPKWIGTMPSYGADWARIWTAHWYGGNPGWSKAFVDRGRFVPEALVKWDRIVDAADAAGVRFQLVLFYHGPWSSDVNSNWAENPWNAKNGGFLKAPEEFFTSPRARILQRKIIREFVARYAADPSVMAWELFNEVEWTDGVKKDPAHVGRWHEEMASYIRTLDPYSHLVTTSSRMDLPIWKGVDYFQPHGYPASVAGMVRAAETPGDKPLFYGEVGPGVLDARAPVQRTAIRDGIWTALFKQQAGAAQFWSWDVIARERIQEEWLRARRILTASELLKGPIARPELKRITPDLKSGLGADLTIAPGRGWAPSEKVEFRLPSETGELGKLSSYLQGRAHPEMQPGRWRFTFRADAPGTFSVKIGEASAKGGSLVISIDGFASTPTEFKPGRSGRALVVGYQEGEHTIELSNPGPDWVNISGLTFTGISANATAEGITDGRVTLLRLQRAASGPVRISLAEVMPRGDETVSVHDLDSSVVRQVSGREFEFSERDAIALIRTR